MTKNKWKAIIVDDEKLARDGMRLTLEEFEEVEVIGEAADGFEAVKLINKLKPDLVFLDIQMPKLDGFDVISLLGDERPHVVFVTAFDEYALKAFEVHAMDYLLKPVSPERLATTLQKLAKEMETGVKQEFSSIIDDYTRANVPVTRIVVRDGTKVHIIPLEEVMYIKAEDDYISIYTSDHKSFLKHDTLSKVETQLPANDFCRIHRSYIVNITCISKIEPYSKDSKVAILTNGEEIAISRTGYNRLMELL
ncbi:response regulator [Myxococcota bacterium]|nr:response regulator [Myxococcota bacterium]